MSKSPILPVPQMCIRDRFNAALWAAPVINGLPRFMKYNDLDDWGKGRELPEFAKESFNEMWKKNKVQGKEETK